MTDSRAERTQVADPACGARQFAVGGSASRNIVVETTRRLTWARAGGYEVTFGHPFGPFRNARPEIYDVAFDAHSFSAVGSRPHGSSGAEMAGSLARVTACLGPSLGPRRSWSGLRSWWRVVWAAALGLTVPVRLVRARRIRRSVRVGRATWPSVRAVTRPRRPLVLRRPAVAT